ncbi:glycoside hydrolase [Massariosphaeria phaeospora]|uniref:alpha-1,2-Mannosidase n=1 Tax=Massariosphaeria phaeospora TaxID=100035 RepID=A0A7C8IID5_9PLEO|nr:glycoside hydrolase [Massariosphaeria phaeospora]
MAWLFAILTLAFSSFLYPAPSAASEDFIQRQLPAQRTVHYGNNSYPGQKGRDYDYTSFPENQTYRAEAVIEMFRFAWNGYYTYAFPHDDLLPVNNSFKDSRNGWGVAAVDGLDTAIMMEQEDIVNQILDFVPTIDFTKTNTPEPSVVSLFETNIRYVGGLLSAYDLLKGPFSHLDVDDEKVDALLSQCKSLADTLKFAFDTPTGIPVNNVFPNNRTFSERLRMADGTRTASLAELGTLVLEWQHLSDLTGDPEYGDLAQKAQSYWFDPAFDIWPGLTGGNFSIETGEVLDGYGGWTSGNDSAYEYLIKMYVYDPERYENYSKRFIEAADSTIAHLLSHPSSRPDLTMAGSFVGTAVQNYSEQLACFIGGTFILGSTVLDRPDYLDYGLQFSEFCANGYRYAASGIGPILYSWNLTQLSSSNFTNQTEFYEKSGWFINDEYYYYRNGQAPEAIESWYYAYQVTGSQYWRDVAWAYTLAQNRTERVGSGFSSILNVLDEYGGGWENFQASYMLAEVLKYQYLIQLPEEKKGVWDVEYAPDGVGNGGNVNYFVYNTEAHPFKPLPSVSCRLSCTPDSHSRPPQLRPWIPPSPNVAMTRTKNTPRNHNLEPGDQHESAAKLNRNRRRHALKAKLLEELEALRNGTAVPPPNAGPKAQGTRRLRKGHQKTTRDDPAGIPQKPNSRDKKELARKAQELLKEELDRVKEERNRAEHERNYAESEWDRAKRELDRAKEELDRIKGQQSVAIEQLDLTAWRT